MTFTKLMWYWRILSIPVPLGWLCYLQIFRKNTSVGTEIHGDCDLWQKSDAKQIVKKHSNQQNATFHSALLCPPFKEDRWRVKTPKISTLNPPYIPAKTSINISAHTAIKCRVYAKKQQQKKTPPTSFSCLKNCGYRGYTPVHFNSLTAVVVWFA